jgi:hypothetical protein
MRFRTVKNSLQLSRVKKKDVKIVLLSLYEKICIEGDKNRLTRVISNVLIDTQNFTEKGAVPLYLYIDENKKRRCRK